MEIFQNVLKNLYKRGLKAVFKLRKSFQGSFPSFNTCMHLFDHLVKPILSYRSDIWGSFLVKGATIDFTKLVKCDLEKCHQMFLRSSIGINKKAPLIGLYGETGRVPLAVDMICNSLKYLNRLKDMPRNSILYQCYLANVDITHKNSWWSNISKILKDFGCPSDPQKIRTAQIKRYLYSNFKDYWHDCLFDDSKSEHGNKLRNYRLYKNCFRKEEYLTSITYKPYRSSLAKLRLSAHKLRIETGRYTKKEEKLSPSERICMFCPRRECENEYHLIMKCNLYENERKLLKQNAFALYPHVQSYDDPTLYQWFMANLDENILMHLSKFIYICFDIRSKSTCALSNS